MFCSNFGKDNREDDNFFEECGNVLTKSNNIDTKKNQPIRN